MKKYLVISTLCFLLSMPAYSAIISSAQTGDWDTGSTWVGGSVPAASDDVIIMDGHTVTKSHSGSYTHNGGLIIEPSAILIMDVGNSSNGFTYSGGDFHIFGELDLPFPDRDLIITGNSFFWAHDGAIIFVSDDLKIEGNSTNIVENICLEVDDDFHIVGTNTTLCGSGGVSVGNNAGSNNISFESGATAAQICTGTVVYRGPGGSCVTVIQNGTGNNPPVAVEDATSTYEDVAVSIDVLDMGTPDSDADSDDLIIMNAGSNGIDGNTSRGGTVSLNDNGTPGITTDDFVDYTPPAGYTGQDTFTYVILDGNGGLDLALGIVTVNAALPVELTEFKGIENGCENILMWTTASEENNDYFEIEKSTDGRFFAAIGKQAGRGTISQFQLYQFTDPNPHQISYYRLRQVDFDGTATLSEVLTMKNACAYTNQRSGIVKIFPNPLVEAQLSIKILTEEDEEEQIIEIVNQNAVVIQRMRLNMEQGMNTLRLDMSLIPAGIYYIKCGRTAHRFVKLAD